MAGGPYGPVAIPHKSWLWPIWPKAIRPTALYVRPLMAHTKLWPLAISMWAYGLRPVIQAMYGHYHGLRHGIRAYGPIPAMVLGTAHHMCHVAPPTVANLRPNGLTCLRHALGLRYLRYQYHTAYAWDSMALGL